MIKQLNNAKTHLLYNRVFYFLRRVPILKNQISEFVYDRYENKTRFKFLKGLIFLLKNTISKFAYFFFAIFALGGLILLFLDSIVPFETSNQLVFVFLWSFFNFFGIVMAHIQNIEDVKLFLISLQVPFNEFYNYSMKNVFNERLFYSSFTFLVLLFLRNHFDLSILLILMISSNILISHFYFRNKIKYYALNDNTFRIDFMTNIKSELILLIPFIIHFILLIVFPVEIGMIFINLVLLGFIYYYYRKFSKVNLDNTLHKIILQDFNTRLTQSQDFIDTQKEQVAVKELKEPNIDYNRHYGYDLFDRIFIDRISFVYKKRVRLIQTILTVLFTIGFITLLILKYKVGFTTHFLEESDILSAILLGYILIFYLSEIGKNVTKAYYQNGDYSMLHYPFYFDKNNLWKQFIVRLRVMFKIQFEISSVMILFSIIYTIVFPELFPIQSVILLFIAISLFIIIFSIIDLSVYYLLQPYTKNLEIDSWPFTILYFLFYLLMRLVEINVNKPLHILMLGIFTLLLFVFTIVPVRIIGHKTFKYKD